MALPTRLHGGQVVPRIVAEREHGILGEVEVHVALKVDGAGEPLPGGNDDATTPGVPCDNFDGTQLYTGVLGAGGAAVGSPAAGGQAGDRTLNGLSNETLCFRIQLPLATGNAYAAATAVTTFTFDAEQTANN